MTGSAGAAGSIPGLRAFLDLAYARFNRPELIHPDPLELVLGYEGADDREVAGLLSACLATGRVASILSGARSALRLIGESPARGLEAIGREGLIEAFAGFRYRFFSGRDIALLLWGAARLRAEHGSLGSYFRQRLRGRPVGEGSAMAAAMADFSSALRAAAGGPFSKALLPNPEDGSACKRPMLWLRWMARRDAVDPGPWEPGLEPYLLVPLDTHMDRVGRGLGLLRGRARGIKAALELTASFREIAPEDPARYDFALTRPGINACVDTGPDFECLRA
jgi:uncharacterized protein (TIGR02757 family)